ncbi:hypothetical protein U27_01448 [Candidatus Vecturithrix granuli]|uniref:Uncharacterized protein n=1 Tax=Vecturithrix granuli TaxID=1499967 RepID=A0A081CAE2_VECG1|nr:hypothetical protein U27_01448 [Candidatus Vecturithrix granuli]
MNHVIFPVFSENPNKTLEGIKTLLSGEDRNAHESGENPNKTLEGIKTM